MKLPNQGFASGYVDVIMSVLYTYQMLSNNITGGASEARTAYPFASPEFFPGCVTGEPRRVPLMAYELLSLTEHPNSPSFCLGLLDLYFS
jgi:hypothetical protein